MAVELLEKQETTVVEERAMPPPRSESKELFRGMDQLRDYHGGSQMRDRLMPALGALIGTVLLFAAMYASLMFMD
jgi:hypothetical protein